MACIFIQSFWRPDSHFPLSRDPKSPRQKNRVHIPTPIFHVIFRPAMFPLQNHIILFFTWISLNHFIQDMKKPAVFFGHCPAPSWCDDDFFRMGLSSTDGSDSGTSAHGSDVDERCRVRKVEGANPKKPTEILLIKEIRLTTWDVRIKHHKTLTMIG